MTRSSIPLLFRITVLSVALGAASGVIGSALTTAYLSDYASALGTASGPLRIPGSRVPPSASLADARELAFGASAQLYAAKTDAPDPLKADRQGVVLTSDGWVATGDAGKGLATAVVGRRAYAIQKSVTDAYTGVTFLKLDARNLATIGFGDAFALGAGDDGYAVEARDALRRFRVVSVVRPANIGADKLARRIATDAPPSVSGIPAFSPSGDLLGFISADGALTPVNAFLPAFRSLLREGKIIRPALGVTVTDLSRTVVSAAAATVPESGMRVTSVAKGSAAATAGLVVGDVITTLDGRPVDATHPLDEALLEYAPGQTVLVAAQRGDARQEFSVVLR